MSGTKGQTWERKIPNRKEVTVSLSGDTYNKIAYIADNEMVSMSAVLRKMIAVYLRDNKLKQYKSIDGNTYLGNHKRSK